MINISYVSPKGVEQDLLAGNVLVTELSGIDSEANINTSSTSGVDGEEFVSAETPKRCILMTLTNFGPTKDNIKPWVYRMFPVKSTGTLKIGYDEEEPKKISCLVEKIDFSRFTENDKCQISLICPQPYFENLTPVNVFMARTIGKFEFPFEIPEEGIEFAEVTESLIAEVTNSGEIVTGCVFRIKATSSVSNPKIENINTHEWFKLELDMLAGDILEIDTRDKIGKTIYLTQNGIRTNVFNTLVYGSKFLQLDLGLNEFRYSADINERNMEITCILYEKYGGV